MASKSKVDGLEVWQQMAASMSGAGVTALTMTPFDVVKGQLKFLTITGVAYKRQKILKKCKNLIQTYDKHIRRQFKFRELIEKNNFEKKARHIKIKI